MRAVEKAHFLETARHAVLKAVEFVAQSTKERPPRVDRHDLLGKEVKLDIDQRLSELLTYQLNETGIAVISEESPASHTIVDEVVWLIDPLDGSYNFLRSAGPSAVCVALLEGLSIQCGVVYDLQSNRLYSGGRGIGALCDGVPIAVSTQSRIESALVYTGVPSRMDMTNPQSLGRITNLLKHAQKIRMIGSAAVSLVNVASGIGDVYLEEAIMPWDVAAGIAVVEGAGGLVHAQLTSRSQPIRVVAGSHELVELLSAE